MNFGVIVFADQLLVKPDPGLYNFINQGCLTVDNMDDCEEMRLADVRFTFRNNKIAEKSSFFCNISLEMQRLQKKLLNLQYFTKNAKIAEKMIPCCDT